MKLTRTDPLYALNENEKELLWKYREFCCSNLEKLLPKLVKRERERERERKRERKRKKERKRKQKRKKGKFN